jgi:hypothetical protein
MHRLKLATPAALVCLALLPGAAAVAQDAPAAGAPLAQQLTYLLGQASAGFTALRADSIGPAMWHSRYLLGTGLDSATALAASSITELPRQHADGRPGKAVVGVFPLALVAPGDSLTYARYRETITGALPGWQSRSPGGGNWTECADPRRGREIILSSGRTAGGELLLTLSITVHPDTGCS